MKLIKLFNNQKLNVKFTCVMVFFMVIPISIFTGILFHNMRKSDIEENIDYMQYTMERNRDAIQTKIDSINMSTQFFLSDEELLEVLYQTYRGSSFTAKDWMEFKTGEISDLERLVNNNPLLYGVRVYAATDSVQEMMPILFQRSRMDKQEWAGENNEEIWYFNYQDNLFTSYTINQQDKLAALITPVTDDEQEIIGVIESAMTMKDMFPSLYEQVEDEWSCFYGENGQICFGDNRPENSMQILRQIYQKKESGETITTIYTSIEDMHLIVSYLPLPELSGTLICVKDITAGIRNVYRMRNLFLILILLVMVALAYLINVIVKRLLYRFYEIMKSIRKVQKGNLNVIIENCGNDEMGELGLQINKMLERIRQLMEDNLKREMLMKNSEIRALQNQINAHFIYNVLESIKMMAEIDEEYAISDAVTALGKLLRYSMKWVSKNVLVEEELEYIRNYMALINLRFDYEIGLSINISDEILHQEIPKMSLQPIVENAIYHGIEQIAEETTICIKGMIEQEDCVIEIVDAGKGMTEEEVKILKQKIDGEIDSNGGSGNGIGLKNVQDRIRIEFGEKYGIEIASKLGCYTKIRVRIPFVSGERRIEYEKRVNCGR